MRIQVNDTEYTIPSSLSEFTLGQRIAFQREHGDMLDKMAESISKMEDEFAKEMETMEFSFEKMVRTMSFFTGIDVDVIKESESLDDIASIYFSCMATLVEDEQNMGLEHEHVWKGETWEIASPKLSQGHKLKFGEFIDAKQLVKDMHELGKGRWEPLVHLCAIYLRKKGEPYKEEFLYEGSDRLKMMEDLPMNIALQVGFFLSSSMNIYINTLRSSGSLASNPAAKI